MRRRVKECVSCGRTGPLVATPGHFPVCDDCLQIEVEETGTDQECSECGKRCAIQQMAISWGTCGEDYWVCKPCHYEEVALDAKDSAESIDRNDELIEKAYPVDARDTAGSS